MEHVEKRRVTSVDALAVEQSGALPYRFRGGRVEVLLVTGRRSGRWIIPKGHVEPHLGPARSAAVEALEEAGALGRINGRSSVGQFEYGKRGRTHVVDVYDLEIRRELADWPERGQREREWMRVGAAARRVSNKRLRKIIEGLPGRISCERLTSSPRGR